MPESKVQLPTKFKNKLADIVRKHNFRTGENLDEEGFVEELVKKVIVENELEEFKGTWRKQKEDDFKRDVDAKRAAIEGEL